MTAGAVAPPTLEEIRTWPATVDVRTAALALGISSSTAYEWIKLGEFPARVLSVRGRHRVITSSLLEWLDALNSDLGPLQRKSEANIRREIEAMVREYRTRLLEQFGLSGSETAGSP